ncbi:hypothetical protein MTO96_040012, partial [Rhipicephalus appendiculatus]
METAEGLEDDAAAIDDPVCANRLLTLRQETVIWDDTAYLDHEGNALELTALREKYKDMHCQLEEVQYASIDEFWLNNGIATEEEYIRVLKAGISRPT